MYFHAEPHCFRGPQRVDAVVHPAFDDSKGLCPGQHDTYAHYSEKPSTFITRGIGIMD